MKRSKEQWRVDNNNKNKKIYHSSNARQTKTEGMERGGDHSDTKEKRNVSEFQMCNWFYCILDKGEMNRWCGYLLDANSFVFRSGTQIRLS